MDLGLTFDDVCLVPCYNNVPSRGEPEISSWLTRDIETKLPLIPANMDTVIGPELAQIIINNGGVPIFHRFTDLDTQRKWINEFKGKIFISAGLNNWDDLASLLEEGPLGVCLDVAHGHSETMVKAIRQIKFNFPHIQVIAGNVCTEIAYHDLVIAGADAVKVGIGPGAACTTRVVTGFGVPQFTAVKNCGDRAQKLRVPIIADGGIRNSRDVVLALAAGASTVMMGKVFALTFESAAEKLWRDEEGNLFSEEMEGTPGSPCGPRIPITKYRGQASKDFQDEYYGGLKDKTVAEGTDFWAPVTGRAQKTIDEILGGLRSGLTYGGARTIKELQRKAEFMRVTGSYGQESHPRRV